MSQDQPFISWVGPYVGWNKVSGDLQGRANSVSQGDGVSDMTPTCWLCWLSAWEKAIPQLSPWCQPLQLLPLCHWCLLRCYPSAGAQREWVCVSSCVSSLKGTAWDSRSFFYQLNPHWFLQPEVVRTCLPHTGTLAWGVWGGAGTPHSWDILPESPSTFPWMWEQPVPHLFPSYQSGCMWFP